MDRSMLSADLPKVFRFNDAERDLNPLSSLSTSCELQILEFRILGEIERV